MHLMENSNGKIEHEINGEEKTWRGKRKEVLRLSLPVSSCS